jgi:hypothetical protein
MKSTTYGEGKDRKIVSGSFDFECGTHSANYSIGLVDEAA